MKFSKYLSESKNYTTRSEIENAIEEYKKAGEVLNPEFINLKERSNSVITKVFEQYKKVYGNTRREMGTDIHDEHAVLWDVLFSFPTGTIGANSFAKKIAKAMKDKNVPDSVKEKLKPIFDDMKEDIDGWIKVNNDLKELKKMVVKVTQKRAEAKAKVEKERYRDSSTLIKELESVEGEYLKRAEKIARDEVKYRLDALKKNGMDLNKLVPSRGKRPTSEERMMRAPYVVITRSADVNDGKPMTIAQMKAMTTDIREADKKSIERFVKISVDDAKANYRAFINKMVDKIGKPVVKADFKGSIWSNALLTIEDVDGDTQVWKTKAIINYSKYRKAFHQFPSRKQK